MTDIEIGQLCTALISQCNLLPDKVKSSLDFWKPNLVKIEHERAMEALKVLLVNDSLKGKEPGKWIGAIVRYCGQDVSRPKVYLAPKAEGCPLCFGSGSVEVPHKDNWNESGQWEGQYTMSVACHCGMGQLIACRQMNLRQYESRFPQWRQEYPIRRHEWQLSLLRRKVDTIKRPEDRKISESRIKDLLVLTQEMP